jgi:putative phosphoesterase
MTAPFHSTPAHRNGRKNRGWARVLPWRMRVALISDLHANELALVAVRRRIAELGVDLVACLGDVATMGARPREVLDHVRDLGGPCILGNHDEFLFDRALVEGYAGGAIVAAAVDWCTHELRPHDLDFVRGFAREATLDLDGVTLRLFHGSPRSNLEDLLATTPPDKLDEALAGRAAPVLAGGHTHLAMLRQHHGMLLVNPGSVGMPIQDYVGGRAPVVLDHAEFAIVDGGPRGVEVTLHKVALDRRALRAQADSADHPLRAPLAAMYS